ncbi:hypothetical protein D3C80_2005730 [compost metagenome]
MSKGRFGGHQQPAQNTRVGLQVHPGAIADTQPALGSATRKDQIALLASLAELYPPFKCLLLPGIADRQHRFNSNHLTNIQ